MKRKVFLITVFIISILFLSGCWNSRELNEIAIAVGLGIDKEDNQFVVTYQVVNPSQVANKAGGGGGDKSPVIVFQAKGDTLFEAMRRVTTQAPRKIYMAHLRTVILGEAFAKEGIGEVLDFLLRDHELRSDFFLVVAKDSNAGDILKIITSLENIPANKLFSSLETSERAWAPTITVKINELVPELISDGISAKLTGIVMKGDVETGQKLGNVQQAKPGTILYYEGIAVFNSDKLIGWLDEDESKGLNYSLGKVNSTIVNIPCPEVGKAGIEVIRTKANLKAKVDNNSPKGKIELQVEGNVGDVACKTLDLTKTKTITFLEKEVAKDIKSKIEKALQVSKEEYKIDTFGFGEAIHRYNPKYWKKNKNEWNQLFVEMKVDIKVDVQIRQMGNIENSPLNKIKD